MYRLSLIIGFVSIGWLLHSQNPHGDEFVQNCADCHNNDGWAISMDTFHFDHDTTAFALSGRHLSVDCKSCHVELIFGGTSSDCISCHNDIHNMTVGDDCARCHSSDNWLVDIIPELHESNGFPLQGAHAGLFCIDCHKSDSQLRFDRLGNDCINCHLEDYENTMDPPHAERGFSKNCADCHSSSSFDWEADVIDHSFFPLTLGHDTRDCSKCHLGEDYSDIDANCVSCHLEDFNATSQPDHEVLGFDMDCASCHTTNPGWSPANFLEHDLQYFPIYSGEHEGEWDECIDCHTNPNDFSVFSCTVCHELGETNDEHDDVAGYTYEDRACYACHPNGDADGAFDHNSTNFPLTGAHLDVDCLECHTESFAGTPTDCFACHEQDFIATLNPDHEELNLPNDCVMCHTTDPGWIPATFDIHDQFYELRGAHALIADDCAACHNGDYVNTPSDCFSCHSDDYNSVTDPDHASAGFGRDCLECHTEDAWLPATFDHDAQHFPIYSGAHEGEWMNCLECHTDPNDFSRYDCLTCHTNPETDDQHELVGGYQYNNDLCLACHPDGDAGMAFDHNNTLFPLTGAHLDVDCLECHADGFKDTPMDCFACHDTDFEATVNPSHMDLGLETDCAACHTTEPGWMPARFDIHDQFYTLNGAHALISMDCIACHNGDYVNTPNECVGCHLDDYNSALDPNHAQAGFNTDCTVCHTEDAWLPSTFDHDAQHFPIYSGAHEGEWTECIDCHINPMDYGIYSCVNCHLNPETDDDHEDIIGYVYNDNACLGCHPTGDTDMAFDHNMTAFPLTGAHIGLDCLECHANGYQGTSTDCYTCHTIDYESTVNPSHGGLSISTDCSSCHTTEPGWMPAIFPVHDQYYPLNGAHALIANDCVSCHAGDYENTPNTCVGCHLEEYNATTNPNHEQASFSTDCVACHTEDAWIPSTFDHDAQHFPIYSGSHLGVWMDCTECHTNPGNFEVFSCVVCHLNPETDDAHNIVGGYIYEDNACIACHPNGESEMAFDHNMTAFPLTGGHIGVDCIDCHMNGYIGTPMNCDACHLPDYNASVNPNHLSLGLPITCESCHTTDPGWEPASFDIHDQFYPLTGGHALVANDCALCHQGDYVNTPNTCEACHIEDYNTSVNPSHLNLGLSTDCMSCHTTNPDWQPASFDVHNDYYELLGAHAMIADDCAACHMGDYVNTPNTCVGCHLEEYNATTNPNHIQAMFSQECELCHTQDSWVPSTFDHDAMHFPIYSGTHFGEWSVCTDCHTNPNNLTEFSCVVCHLNPETDDEHIMVGGYIYEDNACLSCHPTGESMNAFDHNNTMFPLTGGHIGVDCLDCHMNGFIGTPTNCDACHLPDYNATTNPDHPMLAIPITCDDCHTTDPGWTPATFDIHDQYYPLTGAHLDIATDCIACHMGDYVNTPNTCDGCHMPDYNATTNPNHSDIAIPTTCDDCHTTDPGWTPATFDIHDQYYPLTGAHNDISDDCFACHMGDYVNTPNTCDGCHMPDYNATTSPDHQEINIPTTCDDCHTTDPGWTPATFDIHDQYYPLTGAHEDIASDCFACHMGDYVNTPNTCDGCHLPDYNSTTNPDHQDLNLPLDCDDCHTTDPDWMPATFDIHDDFYELIGAHAAIANDCFTCHMGDYNNTPNTCIGCHQEDYDGTTDPDHNENNLATDCLDCHNQDAWVPADFDHDQYWVLNGAHLDIQNDCFACHMGDYTSTPTDCIGCHQEDYDGTTNPDHAAAMFPTDCTGCHTEDAWIPANWDHDGMYFPIFSGKHEGEWTLCIECHTVANDFTQFSCIDCHEHNDQAQVDDDHDGVSGYVYDSAACYSCHPTGEE